MNYVDKLRKVADKNTNTNETKTVFEVKAETFASTEPIENNTTKTASNSTIENTTTQNKDVTDDNCNSDSDGNSDISQTNSSSITVEEIHAGSENQEKDADKNTNTNETEIVSEVKAETFASTESIENNTTKTASNSTIENTTTQNKDVTDDNCNSDSDGNSDISQTNSSSITVEEIHAGSENQEEIINKPWILKNIETTSYEQRQQIAIEIASYFCDNKADDSDILSLFYNVKKKYPILECNENCFIELLNTFNSVLTDNEQKKNILVAFILFYVFSAGKYPQTYWTTAIEKLEDSVLRDIRNDGKFFANKLCNLGYYSQSESIKLITKEVVLAKEIADITKIGHSLKEVGFVKIYELFWDVFVMKYSNFRPVFWKSTITELLSTKYGIRNGCEYKESEANTEIYAVSYEGLLKKPMHTTCEDCCIVSVYDSNTWLTAVADGVGSCLYSSFGSQVAVNELDKIIRSNLKTIINKKNFLGKTKPITSDDWAKLMYFFKFELANQFYSAWEEAVTSADENTENTKSDISQFSSTLQFAFGCESFIACGRIGDGTFFVRKKEVFACDTICGGMILNDGISGVTQSSVLTISHLKNNSSALQVDFFKPIEVSDIIISTDGVSNYLGQTVLNMNEIAVRLNSLSFDERSTILSEIARQCSDYNVTHQGSGDDSTIAYIHFKD